MSKCLVTQLKATVQNSDLLRLGEARIKFTSATDADIIDGSVVPHLHIKSNKNGTCSVITPNAGFCKSSVSDIPLNATEFAIQPNEDIRFGVNAANTEVGILDKYGIVTWDEVNIGNMPFLEPFDIELFRYSEDIDTLYSYAVTGDISVLSDKNSLYRISIDGRNNPNGSVFGDIVDLPASVTSCRIIYSNIGGDIKNVQFDLTRASTLVFHHSQITGDVRILAKGLVRQIQINNTRFYGYIENFVEDAYSLYGKTYDYTITAYSSNVILNTPSPIQNSIFSIVKTNTGATVSVNNTVMATWSNGVWTDSNGNAYNPNR